MKKNKKGVFAAVRSAAATHKLLSMGTLLCTAASVLASLLPPLLLGQVIDSLTGGVALTFGAVLAYFGSLALEGALASGQEILLEMFGQKMTHALRSEMSQKLTHLEASTLAGQNPGEIAARFSGDVDTVEALFTSGVISMAADVCRLISIFAVIAIKNTGLALLLLLVLPVLTVFTRHVQKRMLAAQLENRRAVAGISGQVPEALHNIRTIHALGLENYMEKRYDTYINESYRAMEKTNFYDAVYSPVILITNAVVVAVVMLLSASGNTTVLTLFGMSAGTAVAVINYISQIFTPVESLGMEIQTIQSALAGIHRINEFFALEENPDTVPTHELKTIIARSGSVPFVEFRDVTFGYDKRVVLDHLSFKVMDGDQVTLTGRTGAGKSTIFKLLLGLYKPQSGEVLIHGVPAADIRDDERRRLFGCVEQTFHMVPGTVRDQITLYDSTIRDEAVHTAAELTGLKDTIESMEKGYDTRCTDDLFSQGQWQLLSIARAAAAAPSMLLFDEITANLDAETERAVLSALKRVAENRTVISISHRTSAELGRIIALTD